MTLIEVKRLGALLLGLLTAWPIIYVALFLISITIAPSSLLSLPYIDLLHIGTIALVALLLVYYLIHTGRNPNLSREQRLFWIIAILVGHFVTSLAYWFVNIWRPTAAVGIRH